MPRALETSFVRPRSIATASAPPSAALRTARALSAGVSVLFGKGTANGLDFRNEAFENDTNFLRVPVKERILIISIGGDIGQTADVVKTAVKEKKTEQEIEAENEAEREARLAADGSRDGSRDSRPLKNGRLKRAKSSMKPKSAPRKPTKRSKELKATKPRGNLDAEDQGALQGATQSGVGAVR